MKSYWKRVLQLIGAKVGCWITGMWKRFFSHDCKWEAFKEKSRYTTDSRIIKKASPRYSKLDVIVSTFQSKNLHLSSGVTFRLIPLWERQTTSLLKCSCRRGTTNCATGGLWVWSCMRCSSVSMTHTEGTNIGRFEDLHLHKYNFYGRLCKLIAYNVIIKHLLSMAKMQYMELCEQDFLNLQKVLEPEQELFVEKK